MLQHIRTSTKANRIAATRHSPADHPFSDGSSAGLRGRTLRSTSRLTVFVPITGNEGVPFPNSAFTQFESFVLDLAGGLTQGGQVQGLWRDKQTTYADTNREYILIVPRSRARVIALAVIDYIKKEFRQLAVYVELTPVFVAGF